MFHMESTVWFSANEYCNILGHVCNNNNNNSKNTHMNISETTDIKYDTTAITVIIIQNITISTTEIF